MQNKKYPFFLALLLFMSAFFVSGTAIASGDSTAPTVNAWISGEMLLITASDDTGVDAIVVDGVRINYTVNNSVSVRLKDYAGQSEKITIYAVDFAGNKSDSASVQNPYYSAPTAKPAKTASSTPKPIKPSSGSKNTKPIVPVSPSPSPSTEPEPIPAPEPTPAVPSAQPNPFTAADGTGAVVDNADGETDGKEFFTITTPDENTFYLVIDRQKGNHNVYFLDSVKESDLLSLSDKDKDKKESEAGAIPTPEPVPEVKPEKEPEPEPEVKKKGVNPILIVALVIAFGGAVYYFKVVKPKQSGAGQTDDFENDGFEDDDGYGDEYEFEDDVYGMMEDDTTDDEEQEPTYEQ